MKINPQQNPYRYFLYRGLRFFLILALLDQGIGFLFQKMYFSQKSGKYARIVESVEKTEADVLLMGTSHTVRHFVPEVFADSLNQTVYNVGARGQNLYYCMAVMDAILARHQPDKIVFNIDPDMFYNPGNYDKMSELKPFYWNTPAVRNHVDRRGAWEKILLLSRLYTYNSTIVHLIRYRMQPQIDFDGYLPLEGESPKTFTKADQKRDAPEFEISPDQLTLLEKGVQSALEKRVKICFVISPILAGDYVHSSAIEELARKHNIPLWNYSLDERFVLKNALFGDQSHLNNTGAIMLSKDIAHRLKTTEIEEKLADSTSHE